MGRMGSVKCQKDGEVTMAGWVENSPGPPAWLLPVGAGMQERGSGRSSGDSRLSVHARVASVVSNSV